VARAMPFLGYRVPVRHPLAFSSTRRSHVARPPVSDFPCPETVPAISIRFSAPAARYGRRYIQFPTYLHNAATSIAECNGFFFKRYGVISFFP
jgi:hypothetical protein